MTLMLDGVTILRAILDRPEDRPDVRRDLDVVGERLLAKQIKGRSTSLQSLRRIHAAVGNETMSLLLEGLPSASLRSLTMRIDRYLDGREAMDDAARRAHLLALAEGSLDPQFRSPKAAAMAAPSSDTDPAKTKGGFLDHKAFTAAPVSRAKPAKKSSGKGKKAKK